METLESDKTIKFTVSSKVARLLGRESVSSDTAALFELIKNSYDADANKVIVSFKDIKNSDKKKGTIIISDDGTGITYEEFERKWMVIGTYSKDIESFTKKGRRMLGSKGVGRFATEKISKHVTIISRPQSTNEEIRLEIDWTQYENRDLVFNEIPNKINVIENRTNLSDHGLTIILSDLRNDWNIKKITRLIDSISSMLIPKELQKFSKDEFEVIIDAAEFKTEIKPKVESLLFDNAPFKVTATIPEDNSKTTVTIMKEGKIVSQPPINLKDTEKKGTTYHPFGRCSVTLYYYPGRSNYENWDEYYTDVLKTGHIRNVLKDYHGIKLYRDGFWVRPYGGPDDDWLELEAERVQSNLSVGNSQVIGFVEITRDGNPEIVDTTTRERLDENNAFQSLRMFVKGVVDELSNYRIEENKRLKEESPRYVRENIIVTEITKLQNFVEETDDLLEYKNRIKEALKRIVREFEKYKKENVKQAEISETEERGFRNLATLGIMSASSYHEIFNILSGMKETPTAIANLMTDAGIQNEKINKQIRDLDSQIEITSQFTWLIRQFVRAIGNDVEAKLERESVEIDPIVRRLVMGFVGATDKTVAVTIQCLPNDLTLHIYKSDLISVILNMLTNSIKALDYLPHDEEKKIKILFTKGAFDLTIHFSDNGKGIEEDIQTKIFRPFFTTYENGTGLGLTITKKIIESYGGRIEVSNTPELGRGTTFIISLPLSSLKKVN